jgi:hypothetical protein
VATHRRTFLFLSTDGADKGAISPEKHSNRISYWSRATLGHSLERCSRIRVKKIASLTGFHGTTFRGVTDRFYEA